jgi:anion-transporting  ArsA/GET3 family ATPase
MSLAQRLRGTRICICVGSGGCGKTTTAAAVAVGLAANGRTTAVVTIDPAQRLADALGLPALGNEPERLDPERFAARGLHLQGELWAMRLEPKRTLDELVEFLAPDATTAQQILNNRIYDQLSSAIAGSHEFSAVVKLYDLHRSGRFDAIVLDTPPSRNALDFLDAPARLTGFLEGRALRILVGPGGAAAAAARGSALAFSTLRRLTGLELLEDLSGFFRALGGVAGGFGRRASAVSELLAEPATSFLLVSTTGRAATAETGDFGRRLRERKLRLGGLVVNRIHPLARSSAPIDGELLSDQLGGDPRLADKAIGALADLRTLARRDRGVVDRLSRELGVDAPLLVPELTAEAHDVDGLLAIHRFLFASAGQRAAMLAERAF